jgi:hypothetical protein
MPTTYFTPRPAIVFNLVLRGFEMKLILVTASLLFSALCFASNSNPSAVVFTELQNLAHQPKPKKPLGGSFAEGEKMLRAADPENEANIVFNSGGGSDSEKDPQNGFQLISICGFACLTPGATSEQIAHAAQMTQLANPTATAEAEPGTTHTTGQPTQTLAIPATSDVLNEQNKGYNEIALEFATRFNKQMLKRQFPKPKQPDHIAKMLLDSDLTINGVTIGKSNLYNSIGRFGTNTFHHEGDAGESIYVVCWKGADGTTLAFESGELGGRDQTILEGRVMASGTDYRFDKICKPSKKVDAKISLFGIHLGDSVADVEKKKGPATNDEDQQVIYRYEAQRKSGKKTADVLSKVELTSRDGKITQISAGKTETY